MITLRNKETLQVQPYVYGQPIPRLLYEIESAEDQIGGHFEHLGIFLIDERPQVVLEGSYIVYSEVTVYGVGVPVALRVMTPDEVEQYEQISV